MRNAALLFAGALALLLSNGRYGVSAGPWIATVLLLRFVDSVPRARGLAILLFVHVAAHIVIWRGIIPAPGWIYYAVASFYGVAYFVPFAVHRLGNGGDLGSWRGTLMLPFAWVTVEWVLKLFTPYGSWGSIAYMLDPSSALGQLASLAGTAGVTFVVTWSCAMLSWLTRRPFDRRSLSGLAACGGLLLGAILFGEARLRMDHERAPSLRVATIPPDESLGRAFDLEYSAVARGGDYSDEAIAPLRASAEVMNDALLEASAREGAAGAGLVVWTETAAKVTARDEAALLASASRVARENQILLVSALGVWDPGAQPPLQNKLVAFDDDGAVAWVYHKSRPIIGAESPIIRGGDGILPVWQTTYGSISAVICHDMDFTDLIRQAGQKDIDLLLAPSSDWAVIDRLHGDMARYRAVENGVSVVRAAEGVSFAADPEGRQLVSLNSFEAGARPMVSQMTVRRRFTLYSLGGEWLPWLSIIGLLTLSLPTRRSKR